MLSNNSCSIIFFMFYSSGVLQYVIGIGLLVEDGLFLMNNSGGEANNAASGIAPESESGSEQDIGGGVGSGPQSGSASMVGGGMRPATDRELEILVEMVILILLCS